MIASAADALAAEAQNRMLERKGQGKCQHNSCRHRTSPPPPPPPPPHHRAGRRRRRHRRVRPRPRRHGKPPRSGQPVVVENRPGASGTIGVQQVINANPDGYTVGFVWNSPLTAAPHSTNARYTPDDYVAMFDVGYSAYTLCAAAELSRQQSAGPRGSQRRQSRCYVTGRYTYQTSLVKNVRVDLARSFPPGINLIPRHRSACTTSACLSPEFRPFDEAILRGKSTNDHRKLGPNPSRPGSVRIYVCLAPGIATASAAFAGSGLPSVRRPARIVRYPELLECCFKSAIRRRRRSRFAAISS